MFADPQVAVRLNICRNCLISLDCYPLEPLMKKLLNWELSIGSLLSSESAEKREKLRDMELELPVLSVKSRYHIINSAHVRARTRKTYFLESGHLP